MSKRRRKALPITIYLETWLKVMARKKGEEKGLTLSSYIRELIRKDLDLSKDYDPMKIIVRQLENGTKLYDVEFARDEK
ncbi:hypothetical protein I4641_09440 [Waterburya agarophytonicola K14]|uniref:Uncharacterized protein n=1 Tax=Waterburya agarophytonicola KI4 TaxID=2874699 RepID=A0A964BPJ1_9CYAN|nr:hypothetical protein [Waterburya agarophytonicola]MCC0177199.1 hypothetical protein [Waterburya agarophytonicola KI4]